MSRWNRHQLALYWGFVAAAAIGVAVLSRAIDGGRLDVAFALVATGLAFAVAMGAVLVARVLRGR
jgi:hypothetical protein